MHNMNRIYSGETSQTVVFELDDVIHHILLALRMQMLCEELGDLSALGKPNGICWGNNG